MLLTNVWDQKLNLIIFYSFKIGFIIINNNILNNIMYSEVELEKLYTQIIKK